MQVAIWEMAAREHAGCRGQASEKLICLVQCPLKLRGAAAAAITEPTGRYLQRRMVKEQGKN